MNFCSYDYDRLPETQNTYIKKIMSLFDVPYLCSQSLILQYFFPINFDIFETDNTFELYVFQIIYFSHACQSVAIEYFQMSHNSYDSSIIQTLTESQRAWF